MDAEAIQLALTIATIFDTLEIPYLVGGLVASSILGEPQLIITQNPQRLAWLPSAEDIILQKLIW